MNEEDTDVVNDEIVNNKDFEKSNTEIETYSSIEELTFPWEYEYRSIIILEDSNEQAMNDPGIQAILNRSRHNNSPIFNIS